MKHWLSPLPKRERAHQLAYENEKKEKEIGAALPRAIG